MKTVRILGRTYLVRIVDAKPSREQAWLKSCQSKVVSASAMARWARKGV